jgi:hypothetical protein
MDDAFIGQFMACESGNTSDEAFHTVWCGAAGSSWSIASAVHHSRPCVWRFFGWGVPIAVESREGHRLHEINGNPFERQLRWGPTAQP